MKKLLTILLLTVAVHAHSQDDSLLQRLIDSAKNAPAAKPSPVVKDTQQPPTKPVVRKPDTVNTIIFSPDTTSALDSLLFGTDTLRTDSLQAIVPAETPVKPLPWLRDTAFMRLMQVALANVRPTALSGDGEPRNAASRDFLFYLLVGVVLLLGVIRQLFPRYFQNMLRLMFEASFRQKQRREQLMQETLPSLMMNMLFILVGGLFIALLAEQNHWINLPFSRLALFSITVLAFIYMFKYAIISLSGWLFNVREPASTYSFIVFLVNKVIALALLPLLWLLAFSSGNIREVTVAIAACAVVFLLLFRYIVSLTVIRSTLSIQPFHFFIYLCAVEIMPMLIIYKLLFQYTGISGN